MLASSHDFEQRELQEAFRETFEHRHTDFDDIVAFENGFSDDTIRQSRWDAFTRKKKTMVKVTLQETIDLIYAFIAPIVEGIQKDSTKDRTWKHEELSWTEIK